MRTLSLEVKNNSINETLNQFFRSLIEKKIVDALLVTQKSQGKGYVQTLVKNSKEMNNVNPFAPVLIENSASLVSCLSAWDPGQKIGVVLRPCEIRALIELVKFKQAKLDKLMIIGVDCVGTLEPNDYREIIDKGKKIGFPYGVDAKDTGYKPRAACECCEYPVPANVDMTLGYLGMDIKKNVLVEVKDDNLQEKLKLTEIKVPDRREKEISTLVSERKKRKKRLLKQLQDRFCDADKILKEFDMCRKCYSCRIACPICYCKECIFLTPVFTHKPEQYLRWAERKGKIKLPYQTLLYHLTRLNHMVTSCVACGQCSSACPNDLPVFELFLKVGVEVQLIFEYVPGQNVDEEPPVSTFKETELETIAGDEQ